MRKSILIAFFIAIILCSSALACALHFGKVNNGIMSGRNVAVKGSDETSQMAFSAPTYNATRAGDVAEFQINASAPAGVAGYIFFNGESNSTYTAVAGDPPSLVITSTVTMPSSGSVSVGWFAVDGNGVWTSSGLYTYQAYQMSSQVLEADGNTLYFSNGTSIVLRGVDYTYFMDDPDGSWMMPDGTVYWGTWTTAGVADFVNLCQTWKVNVVRVFLTVEYWENANYYATYVDHLSYFANALQNAGIFVDFCFYRNNAAESEPSVLPWEESGNGYINSPQDFVNLWANFSATFANAPNVIFELWNEPQGLNSGDEAAWFTVAQSCINAIRAAGASNPIVAGWGEGVTYDFYAYASYPSAGVMSDMSFITQYPLSDPAGNIIYTTHIYRSSFYNSTDDYAQPYVLNDSTGFNMFEALNITGVLPAAQNHVVWVGEIGDALWDIPDNQTYEDAWFNNTLTLLDQYGIGYAGFAAPPWSSGSGDQFGFVIVGSQDYTLDSSGIILVDHLYGTTSPTVASPNPEPESTPTATNTPASTTAPSPTPKLSPTSTPKPSPSLTPSQTQDSSPPPTSSSAPQTTKSPSGTIGTIVVTGGVAGGAVAIATVSIVTKRKTLRKLFKWALPELSYL